MNMTPVNITLLSDPLIDCSYCYGFHEAVLGRIGIMIIINFISMAYLVLLRKLTVWNKIDSSWWDKGADWGLIPLLISSIFLLEVLVRGL